LKTLILVEEVYPTYKLFPQGMNDLLALIEAGTETAQIYRLLGDYAIRSGLVLPAESSYRQAIELAVAAHQLEEQVKAQWGLGTLYNRIGKSEQAREQLLQAQQGARTLGDADLLASIEAELP
jgi:tetratricopeptide (TPR) repeat protein